MGRIKQGLGVLATMALAAASVGGGPAWAATQRIARTKGQWQAAIAQLQEPGSGCYHASYPVLQWHAVKCAAAPKWPVAPTLPSASATRAAPATVGNGVDYAAKVSGLISQATGTFQDVSPKITEKGKVNNTGPLVTNAFSLQLNTEFISGSPACSKSSNPSKCLAWQQFVYVYDNSTTAKVFMQYWLLYYDTTCPSGWFTYPDNQYTFCYTNSKASTLPGGPLTAGDLATLKLSGSATSGGKDKVSLSVGSGHATLVTNNDSKIDLAKSWNTTEWGVFGDAGGGEADFGTDTTLEAQTALTATSHSAPTCVAHAGTTAETNNLKLASTPALGSEPSPTMASRQTNGAAGTASCATAA